MPIPPSVVPILLNQLRQQLAVDWHIQLLAHAFIRSGVENEFAAGRIFNLLFLSVQLIY